MQSNPQYSLKVRKDGITRVSVELDVRKLASISQHLNNKEMDTREHARYVSSIVEFVVDYFVMDRMIEFSIEEAKKVLVNNHFVTIDGIRRNSNE